ncbi:tetratricopeptide repeat protein [Clostridium uliginosum]|uniref:Tetratricopeptide repeat-containing protein n=1 Tax=Clostridium uliginosum TaxID=119641 RepID=A0A1I1MME3_9CLOT|nr:tetratricopeptide repeat protein [Clostridium uliginosum]SFC82720.1 Tetratricopeptide repeat-containing protein [Clostridium uliginosum]
MKKQNNKFYNKAIKYYQSGQINKALEICELGLSYSLKSSAILNLKGLLLYQKGNLEGAITVWKINKDFNNDVIAFNYINDAKEDQTRGQLYLLGEKKLKELNIQEAITLFEKCAESDFNSIKVNTALSLCYQKKGQFEKSIEHMNKALSIDKNSKMAKQIKKELIEVKAYKDSSKKILLPLISLVVISLICGIAYNLPKYFKSNKDTNYNSIVSSQDKTTGDLQTNQNEEVQANKEQENLQEASKNDVSKTTFNSQKIMEAISKNDFDSMYLELNNVNEKNLKDEDKAIYRQCTDVLKTSGVENFYERAMKEFNSNNYEKAMLEFEKAYAYVGSSYLKEHVLFYSAVNLDKLSNTKEAVKMYEEYYNEYPKGVYTDNALYNVALLISNIDKDKSLYYATKLRDDFPNSIYLNNNITSILNH